MATRKSNSDNTKKTKSAGAEKTANATRQKVVAAKEEQISPFVLMTKEDLSTLLREIKECNCSSTPGTETDKEEARKKAIFDCENQRLKASMGDNGIILTEGSRISEDLKNIKDAYDRKQKAKPPCDAKFVKYPDPGLLS